MPPARPNVCGTLSLPRLFLAIFTTLFFFAAALVAKTAPDDGRAAVAAESKEIMPLSDVRAGMQGYAYTIFAGDQIEKFDLVVIGVLPNFLGPKQSIILVQLKGPKRWSTPEWSRA